MSKWLLVSLVSAVAGVLLLRATVFAPERVPVQAVRVETGRVESTVTNTKAGTVRARRRALLSAEVGGRVIEIAHEEGAWVETGAPLIVLNPATQQAQLRLAQESLRAAEASRREACVARDRARRELERNRKLAKKRIVSDDVVDRLDSAYEVADASCNAVGAGVEKARAQVSVAQTTLDKMTIRAPFEGVIAEVNVEVGEWITPSPPLLTTPPVIDLINPESLYISAPMDEVDSAAIRKGQRAKISVDSYPGKVFPGEVVRVAPYVIDQEAQNRTVEIEVEIAPDHPIERLLPGTSADVEVILEVRDAVLRMPTTALLDGSRVLLADNGQLVERIVRVGVRNWDFVEILEGLAEDERVVISLDRVEVKPGAEVEVEEISYQP